MTEYPQPEFMFSGLVRCLWPGYPLQSFCHQFQGYLSLITAKRIYASIPNAACHTIARLRKKF